MTDENELVERLKNSVTKHEAFRELMSLYQERLYLHIRTLVLNHDDTDDVLQETFIKIFQNIDKFKGDSKLFSWMYRIATNQALDFLKQRKNKMKVNSEELNDFLIEQLEADSLFDGDEAEILLQKAIATLPEKQQLVFKMKYFQELDYQTISEIVDTSVGALKASYHHAVKKIENFINSN
ncbi:RNA polymerase sigma factor [Myroides phaeus]|uniref:RNA polymerase sigma-70 factor, ECF subfamily n=1 Tax=Myroides phaeus TaxID=702745 RepID=A0A1G8DI42_9FLAO|nr:RNA polymerase sigma factor [Myroides phaeus]SDH57332.1 RNA polymerase sigma-70 factor, ECF subfamily [Myroides phaeus]